MKDKLKAAGLYVLARLSEPSTWKGLILVVTAFGWWDLSKNNQGEAVAQAGLLVVGLINAVLPQATLYRKP
jgi:hypothetical protein